MEIKPEPNVESEPQKNSAYYMSQMRKRLREEGFVQRDVWILPENSGVLRDIEKRLRQPLNAEAPEMENIMSGNQAWNVQSLFEELKRYEAGNDGAMTVKMTDGLNPSIHVVMNEFGELPILIAVHGQQILVQASLFEASAINNTAEFNEAILRSRSLFPLSAIALDTIGSSSVYVMYGALSSCSAIQSIHTEIETLANNVLNAVDVFEPFFINKNQK